MDTALNELIERLRNEAAQIDQAVKMYARDRDKYQGLYDGENERLLSKQELIKFLEASAEEMADPGWKKGDRFRWRGKRPPMEGTVTDTYNDTVYLRTDDGGTLSMERELFDMLVRKL